MIKKRLLVLCMVYFKLHGFCQVSFNQQYYHTPNITLANAGIGDFNGDGKNDVITEGSQGLGPGNFYIFMQTSGGVLNTVPVQIPFSYGGQPYHTYLAVADMNHDNLDDVVFVTGDSLYMYFQSVGHQLSTAGGIYAGSGVSGVAINDIDGDGYKDVAISFSNEYYVSIFYGTATSDSFAPKHYPCQPAGYAGIKLAHVGRQQNLSVLTMTDDTLIAMQIDSQRMLQSVHRYKAPSPPFNSVSGYGAGNRFGDGNYELAVTNGANSPYAQVTYYSHPDTGFMPDTLLPVYDVPQAIIMADLNCDGKDEIIVGHGAWNHLGIIGQDNIEQTFLTHIANNMEYLDIAVGDVTADGLPDIVVVNSAGLTVFQNTTTQTVSQVTVAVDTTYTGKSILTPAQPPVAYLIDTLYSNGYAVIKTSVVALNNVEYDSVMVINTHGFGIGQCKGDTTAINDTSTILLNQVFSQDTEVTNVIYDTIFASSIQNVANACVAVYPVPFISGININYPNATYGAELYSETGALLISQVCKDHCFIPRQTLSPGVYVLKIYMVDTIIYRKVVAQ